MDEDYVPKGTVAIILINIIVFAVLELLGDTEDGLFMASHGALTNQAIVEGKLYCFFTAMFLHFGFMHLVNNMFVLFFIGRYLEQEIGTIPFIIIYIFGGLIGNGVSFVSHLSSTEMIVSAGASGCVFAAIGALFLLVLLRCGRLARLRKQGVIMMVFLSVYQGYTTVGVDNVAHVAGLCGGILIGGIYYFMRKFRRQEDLTQDFE